MDCSAAATKHSMNAAERELYRYYQPIEAPKKTSGRPVVPKASHDVSLTAFAQLGALRLQAKRAIITLATENVEYIVAEAGQTLSLQDENRHDEDDGLWHGVGGLDPEKMVAPKFLKRIRNTPHPAEAYVVINDALDDTEFSRLAVIKNIRFVSSFPIRTPAGTVIGFYVILGQDPRPQGLSVDEIQFMRDMAATVMDHLEAGRVKKKHARAERMVKALGLFVEGQPSLRNWWVTQESQRRQAIRASTKMSVFKSVDEQAEYLFGTQETNKDLHGLTNHRASMFSSAPDTPSSSVTHDPISERFGSISETTTPGISDRPSFFEQDSYTTTFTTPTTTTEESAFDYQRRRMSLYPPDELPISPNSEIDSGRSLQEALLSTKVKDVFARAANLIREAIQLDGSIFFDASVSSFGASAKEKGDEKAPGVFTTATVADATTSGSDEELKRIGTNGSMEHPVIQEAHAHPSVEKGCNILGFSTRRKSTVHGHAPLDEHQTLPEKFLRSLLKKYPHGKVYNFHEDGTMSSSESDGTTSSQRRAEATENGNKNGHQNRKRKTMSKETEARTLQKAFPGARSLVFYPLWDSGRERWFAGGFMWSNSPCRVLCPLEDLAYMASFGNSVMAEVARISAQLASQMKTDFVSSISHELRSPLHGILASVELLQETTMTNMQMDMITTINSCGKTLLDTINHVLDFSKVNRKMKDRKPKKRPRKAKDGSRSVEVEEPARDEDLEDLSILTEEVIESVYAGSALGKRLCRPEPGHKRARSVGGPLISVIVDVMWRPDWRFEIDGGAWRRILMNIFGNSMKYTSDGFVRVVLKSEEEMPSKDGRTIQSAISLTVTDSGKGISQEFLRTHLYTAFAQEDALASGTGLGLSIVRQIVNDLGGSINFTSEKGSGTEAKVILPLKSLTRPGVAGDEERTSVMFAEVREKTKALTTCLVGFDSLPDISEEPTGILSPANQAKLSLKSAISSMISGWFGSELITSQILDLYTADIHIVSEDALIGSSRIWENIEAYRKQAVEGISKIIMILCVTYPQDPILIDEQGLRVFYVQQPFGAHKVAVSLHHALFSAPTNVSNEIKTNGSNPPGHFSEDQLQSPSTANGNTEEYVVQEVSFESEAVPPQEKMPPEPAVAVTESQETNLRVLLVEDNAINLKLLVTYMRKLGLDHATAVNGLEALNLFQDTHLSSPFDAILMDISMPIMDGLTSSRKIRQHENEHKLKPPAIIALTGAASMSARQEAFSAGIDLFLTKPVPLKKLKGILEELKSGGRDAVIEPEAR